MKNIREKERQLRMQRGMEALKMPDKQFKLKQFENVKSRAFDGKPPLPASDSDKIKAQRRLLSVDAPGSTGYSKAMPPPIRTDNVEPDEDENVMSMAAFEAAAERLKEMHANKGQKIGKDANGCPKYLKKIKAGLAEEQREAEEKKRSPAIPAGYRLMPKQEVDETLDALKKKRENLEKEYQRLPFNIETDSQKRREKRILDDIKQTDDGIKLFSRETVIVEA
jgi:hypothetical protein